MKRRNKPIAWAVGIDVEPIRDRWRGGRQVCRVIGVVDAPTLYDALLRLQRDDPVWGLSGLKKANAKARPVARYKYLRLHGAAAYGLKKAKASNNVVFVEISQAPKWAQI